MIKTNGSLCLAIDKSGQFLIASDSCMTYFYFDVPYLREAETGHCVTPGHGVGQSVAITPPPCSVQLRFDPCKLGGDRICLMKSAEECFAFKDDLITPGNEIVMQSNLSTLVGSPYSECYLYFSELTFQFYKKYYVPNFKRAKTFKKVIFI